MDKKQHRYDRNRFRKMCTSMQRSTHNTTTLPSTEDNSHHNIICSTEPDFYPTRNAFSPSISISNSLDFQTAIHKKQYHSRVPTDIFSTPRKRHRNENIELRIRSIKNQRLSQLSQQLQSQRKQSTEASLKFLTFRRKKLIAQELMKNHKIQLPAIQVINKSEIEIIRIQKEAEIERKHQENVQIIQKKWRNFLKRPKIDKKLFSAIKIQKWWRQLILIKQAILVRKTKLFSIFKIQKWIKPILRKLRLISIEQNLAYFDKIKAQLQENAQITIRYNWLKAVKRKEIENEKEMEKQASQTQKGSFKRTKLRGKQLQRRKSSSHNNLQEIPKSQQNQKQIQRKIYPKQQPLRKTTTQNFQKTKNENYRQASSMSGGGKSDSSDESIKCKLNEYRKRQDVVGQIAKYQIKKKLKGLQDISEQSDSSLPSFSPLTLGSPNNQKTPMTLLIPKRVDFHNISEKSMEEQSQSLDEGDENTIDIKQTILISPTSSSKIYNYGSGKKLII